MDITLKRDAVCAECQAPLAAGCRARWYRNGAIYGMGCHEQKPRGRTKRTSAPAPAPDAPIFPVGARVLLDGRHDAHVVQAFPEGSTSFPFPHYKLRVRDGSDSAVHISRVGVDARA